MTASDGEGPRLPTSVSANASLYFVGQIPAEAAHALETSQQTNGRPGIQRSTTGGVRFIGTVCEHSGYRFHCREIAVDRGDVVKPDNAALGVIICNLHVLLQRIIPSGWVGIAPSFAHRSR